MIRKIGILTAVVFLSACSESKEESLVRIEANLPEGCQFFDLGTYGKINTLVMITCDYKIVITVGEEFKSCGKQNCPKEFAVTSIPNRK